MQKDEEPPMLRSNHAQNWDANWETSRRCPAFILVASERWRKENPSIMCRRFSSQYQFWGVNGIVTPAPFLCEISATGDGVKTIPIQEKKSEDSTAYCITLRTGRKKRHVGIRTRDSCKWSLLYHMDQRGAAMSHQKCDEPPNLRHSLPKLSPGCPGRECPQQHVCGTDAFINFTQRSWSTSSLVFFLNFNNINKSL